MEESLIKTAKAVLGGSLEKSVGSEAAKTSGLTPVQQQRYNYLARTYGSDTALLIPLIEGRGKNSWQNVYDKIVYLLQPKNPDRDYIDELYDKFELDKEYSSAEVIGIIGDARLTCGLKPYMSRIKTNCERDFFGLFIIEDVKDEIVIDGKKVTSTVGYIPRFKLKPEE